MQILSYLFFFEGRCEEALEFYQKAVGAKVERMMRYKDSPEPPKPGSLPPGSENKVIHASVRIGETVVLMSDGHCSGKVAFQGFSLTVITEEDMEAEKSFAALIDGGQVMFPLTKTFFSSKFGMVTDRFGVMWMVMVEKKGGGF